MRGWVCDAEPGFCTKLLQPGTYPTAQPPRGPTAPKDKNAGQRIHVFGDWLF